MQTVYQRPGGPERGNRPKRMCLLTLQGLEAIKIQKENN